MNFPPKLQSLDENILLTIQKFRIRPLTWIMILFTWTGKGKFWIFISVVMNVANYFHTIFNPYVLKALFAPLIVWAVNGIVKRKVLRGRPETCGKGIVPLVREDPRLSFPSSHSGSTFSFFFILLFLQFSEARWIGVWAAIVSFSRMYLGVHYLTDILAGILVGLFAAVVVFQFA